jgi:hypothetical protein
MSGGGRKLSAGSDGRGENEVFLLHGGPLIGGRGRQYGGAMDRSTPSPSVTWSDGNRAAHRAVHNI